jgi:hypothetical protein
MTEKEQNKFIKHIQILYYSFYHFIRDIFFNFKMSELWDKANKLRQYAVEYIVTIIPDIFQSVFFDGLAEVAGTGV